MGIFVKWSLTRGGRSGRFHCTRSFNLCKLVKVSCKSSDFLYVLIKTNLNIRVFLSEWFYCVRSKSLGSQ